MDKEIALAKVSARHTLSYSAAVTRLTVIIPALNERLTLEYVADAALATGRASEIIIVDDGSNDGTWDVICALARRHPDSVRGVRHAVNRGKGAAVRTGLALARGDIVLVQDADLEYDPAEYGRLVAPFADPAVSVVYGSRNAQRNPRSSATFYWGGRLLSAVTNLLFGSRLSDESTGYKVIRTDLLRSLDLRSEGFEFCAELTSRLLREGIAIHEVPVSYRPRTFAAGKKIRWHHGVTAIWVMICIRCQSRRLGARREQNEPATSLTFASSPAGLLKTEQSL